MIGVVPEQAPSGERLCHQAAAFPVTVTAPFSAAPSEPWMTEQKILSGAKAALWWV